MSQAEYVRVSNLMEEVRGLRETVLRLVEENRILSNRLKRLEDRSRPGRKPRQLPAEVLAAG